MTCRICHGTGREIEEYWSPSGAYVSRTVFCYCGHGAQARRENDAAIDAAVEREREAQRYADDRMNESHLGWEDE